MKRIRTNPSATTRRDVLGGALALLAMSAGVQAQTSAVPVEVWKDPNCGCCKDWVSHLESNGFKVKVNDTGNNAMRTKLGIDRKYGSCHTAVVAGYAIEGHVPARDIQRLLKDKPQAIGLAVPGMPVGSPGMDGAVYGDRKDSYDVMLLAKGGGATVYQHYEGTKLAAAGTAAPSTGGTAAPASAATGALVDAEVRKIDKANKKVTLKHGEIKNLDMPPMTMVFQVRDASMLDALKVGDKVRFAAANEQGNFVATQLQSAR
jgi:Cu/Ag efflux protein CusF